MERRQQTPTNRETQFVTNSSHVASSWPPVPGLRSNKKIKRWEGKRVRPAEDSPSLTTPDGQESLPIAAAELVCMSAQKW
ncbi:hypothetical protein PoB_007466300 [Plakobranchus ocellatus]|uniref:Uncharacterized protein n=1 Tax=Plakobranchus ocellatus TaxID=259542 RepID=A0AAV4DVQ0_9GAST|nr:hypothetical protein PoB_007466300 [Plakobranchus ocellatus]